MEASYRSSPFFADLDMSNPPPPPPVVPPRPKAPPRRCKPPRQYANRTEMLLCKKEAHSPSAKKESD